MASVDSIGRGTHDSGRLLRAGSLAAFYLCVFTGLSAAGADDGRLHQPRNLGGPAIVSEDSGPAAYRYEAVIRPARFKGTRTVTEIEYEEKVVTYTEPETVYRTVCEDRGCWQACRRWSLLGRRCEYIWCPRMVETKVPEVVETTRQRVERIPHEVTHEEPGIISEPVVVQSRRPFSRGSVDLDMLARRMAGQPSRGSQSVGINSGQQND